MAFNSVGNDIFINMFSCQKQSLHAEGRDRETVDCSSARRAPRAGVFLDRSIKASVFTLTECSHFCLHQVTNPLENKRINVKKT